MIKKIFNTLVIAAILFGTSGFNPTMVVAAQYTGVKDTMSTQAISTTATHVVNATFVGGDTFAAGETLTVDFVDADFTLNAIGNWQTADFTFNDGTSRTVTAVSSVSGTPPTCTAGVNNVGITINTTTNNFIIEACSTYTTSGANPSIIFTINGTTASGTGTMTNKNADVENSQFSITGSNGDTASGALVVETNDVVNITATVAPTLTFSNDDAAIGFATLTTGAARYANAGATGSASRTTAHTMAIGTNATTGYTLTYNGATLTSGAATITAADINGDADGTPGSSQFALAGTETGDGAMSTDYNAVTPNWDFVPSTTTTIATASGVVTSSSIAMEYIANIPASQTAGSYATNLTYVVTGNF